MKKLQVDVVWMLLEESPLTAARIRLPPTRVSMGSMEGPSCPIAKLSHFEDESPVLADFSEVLHKGDGRWWTCNHNAIDDNILCHEKNWS